MMKIPEWAEEVVYFKNGDCVFVNDFRYKYYRQGLDSLEGRWIEESVREYLNRILSREFVIRHEHLNISLENK